jgi:hypothetical protein
MTNKELADKLIKIGYTSLWLDYGVLTIEYLTEQEKIFDKSGDQNTEHYRYHTFRNYLSSKKKLSNTELDNYLQLTFNDSEQLMAGSATVDLFNTVALTDLQFDKLCRVIGHFGEWTEKIVARQKLLKKLRTTKLTGDLFNECIVNGDSVIHEFILDVADLNQLQELVVKGKNKKIRNIATEKFNRLTQQKSR